MKNLLLDCLCSFVLGATFTLLVLSIQAKPVILKIKAINKLTEQCEAVLPRNETCVLVAVPKGE